MDIVSWAEVKWDVSRWVGVKWDVFMWDEVKWDVSMWTETSCLLPRIIMRIQLAAAKVIV